jgi:cyclic pyranopterin monophosphate synthase
MSATNDPDSPTDQPPRSPFSHLDDAGGARMVDVSAKPETARTATATGRVRMGAETRRLLAERALPKGDVLTVARVAGVLAAKRTGELIPLCHPLPLADIQVDLTPDGDGVTITATARCVGRTGVEMEALTAVSVAALTVYDMCKSADKRMTIEGIRLVSKTGGKSGDFRWEGKGAGDAEL